jgi:hypothetical protein
MDAMRNIHKQNEAVFQIMKTELKELTRVQNIKGLVDERLRILREPIRQTTLGREFEGAKGCDTQ